MSQADYDRAVTETAVGSMTVVSGENPDENLKIIRTELKKAGIAISSVHSLQRVAVGFRQRNHGNRLQESGYPRARFFEQAFEWEQLQYVLYPYYWSRKSTWKTRVLVLVSSSDPVYADFVKAGAARVTFAAHVAFTKDVLYFLPTGKPWHGGPISDLQSAEYVARSDQPTTEKPHGEPWEVSVPSS
jgi:hypothetical protein